MTPTSHLSPRFLATVSIAAMVVLAYPLWQLFTQPYLAYMNGIDEGSYLQYDFGEIALHAYWRPGQWLVQRCHEWGLSGGEINLLFDLVALIGVPLLVRYALLNLGVDSRLASFGALGFVYLPAITLGINPGVRALWEWHITHGAVKWFTMPFTDWLPITRTPEPQVSLLLCAVAGAVGTRWRSFLPAYVVAPFLYSFVAVPWVFCTVTFQLLKSRRLPLLAALATSALLLGVALGVYFTHFIPASTRPMIVETRTPLLSWSVVVTALLCGALSVSSKGARLRIPLIALAAILFSTNQQILSGATAQPNNFEQYFGSMVIGAIATWILYRAAYPRVANIALASVIAAVGAYGVRFNMDVLGPPLATSAQEAIRRDASLVAVSSRHQAVLLNMLYPRQPATAFSVSRAYLDQGRMNFHRYACARQQVRARGASNPEFEALFSFLDGVYLFENNDYVLTTILRREPPPPAIDLSAPVTNCPGEELFVLKDPPSTPQ